MSRSRYRPKFAGYNKENWVVQQLTRRKRRRAAKRFVRDYENEHKEPGPERSTGGWFTW